MPNSIFNSIQYLKSVGPKRAEAFKSVGLNTIYDLLLYFPFRYLDRSTIISSKKAREYIAEGFDGELTLIAIVESSEVLRYGKKSLLKVTMSDKMGHFDCAWFQGIRFLKDTFVPGKYYAVSGKPVITKYGHLQFVHPDFDRIEDAESEDFLNTGRIIPFYSLPKGLKEKNIGHFSLRRIINSAVNQYCGLLVETLPYEIITAEKLLPLQSTIKNLHFPDSMDLLQKAQFRIKFEEFFYVQILVAMRKYFVKNINSTIKLSFKSRLLKTFIENLHFDLTDSQLKVLTEIRNDLESGKVMNRLLQGDVGSGKTIVALIVMLTLLENDYQAVLMAPTEVLASQHFINISGILENYGINTVLLIGGQSTKERKNALELIKNKRRSIVIGTHALFEEKVVFNNLGLVVIDEQHRFGVVQRSRLVKKGNNPHLLVMTATPIPRTLSMTIYGDLDISVIDELPKNRMPIKTVLRSEKKLPEIYNFIIERIKHGEQAYIVYPLVEESDKLDLKAAEEYYNLLSETYFSNHSIGLLHGKMNWKDKEIIMRDFANGKFNVLISTTVIEVGIDVPNSTIILINDAYRFGLSQLHQLRGRVGRSDKKSYCILITKNEYLHNFKSPIINLDYLSPTQKEKMKSIIRLNAMITNSSGFDLSEIDLKLRGPGDIFSTKQSGLPQLKYADLVVDKDILIKAKEYAFTIISDDVKLEKTENKLIKNVLEHNYAENIKLSLTP
ncbi:MAG: ATP-dependent DNA helicase RecG [Ignavibacteriae bacterium HGW-Ignavibacteriae-2]|jgi:ATP-dependent DNA helicase RecG|nr:MAG: ATP-dependent DNA helicase RecG [Ignavibacteriae bacterium HGW-Ignavibacteriae-2]